MLVRFFEKIADALPNFILITVVGSLFTFWLSRRRDELSRDDASISAMRELVSELDDLYRSTKQIKRTIRSRLKGIPEGRSLGDEAWIDADFFAARMDELSDIQLKMEQVRNSVKIRCDLFQGDRRSRILTEIGYSEKYLCAVVSDFALRRVVWESNICKLPSSCIMIKDFLEESWRPCELSEQFEKVSEAVTSKERFEAFELISAKARDIDSKYAGRKSISDECLILAIREMRDAITERVG